MNSTEIFTLALGLKDPWKITDIKISVDKDSVKELNIYLGFKRGTKFDDGAGVSCSVHDTQKRTWHHLNFFEHSCHLHCAVPRIRTSDGKVRLVQVPWARSGSGFTLLFEALAMALIEREMPVNKIGQLLGEDAHRIWTIFNHWIGLAYQADDPTGVTQLGFDETSRRKGHTYLTVAVDMEERRVLHVVKGKDSNTIKEIGDYLAMKGMDKKQITQASIDLSPAFISGIRKHFPEAAITFDRFHVVKLLNKAMDTVRKQERREHDALKGHKYTFLRNPENLSAHKQAALSEMIRLYPTLGEAYRLKLLFNDLWEMPSKQTAKLFIEQWCREVEESKIPAFMNFAKTVKAHLSGIINSVETHITNAILESINNKIQMAKRRARGYRNTDNFINMIYFLCGKLKFNYPLHSS
jgi:transposase